MRPSDYTELDSKLSTMVASLVIFLAQYWNHHWGSSRATDVRRYLDLQQRLKALWKKIFYPARSLIVTPVILWFLRFRDCWTAIISCLFRQINTQVTDCIVHILVLPKTLCHTQLHQVINTQLHTITSSNLSVLILPLVFRSFVFQ